MKSLSLNFVVLGAEEAGPEGAGVFVCDISSGSRFRARPAFLMECDH